jgi:hypothetical protein
MEAQVKAGGKIGLLSGDNVFIFLAYFSDFY